MRVLSVLTVLGALTAPAAAATVTITAGPNSFQNIQNAINGVGLTTPLTICLLPGTHSQPNGIPSQISLNNHKNLVITSTNPTNLATINATILDGLTISTNGFVGTGNEDGSTVIEGITIRSMVENGVKLTAGSDARVRWCQIWDNGKAGVRCENGSTSTIKLVDFRRNAASGVRCVTASAPSIDRCVFVENTAHRGGGVSSKSGSAPVITKSDFSGNAAATFGGAVDAYGADAVIEECEISDNSSVDGGGGIAGQYATLTVRDCFIDSNDSRRGGGIYFCSTNACIWDCAITENTASFHGGGVYSAANFPTDGDPLPYLPTDNNLTSIPCNDHAIVNIVTSAIQDNTSGAQGGGIYFIGGSLELHSSLLTGNQGTTGGGGLRARNCNAVIANDTFAENSDATIGGAVHANTGSAGHVLAENSIFWGDTAPSNPELSGPISVAYCDVQGGGMSGTNIDVDPMFLANFCPTNPLVIGAGSNALVPPDVCDIDGDLDVTEPLPFDLFGGPRIIGTVDMGMCEQ